MLEFGIDLDNLREINMSAKVFAIANQKGGTGKTTLTMNFAAGLAKRGRTLVVDTDPQGSALQWAGLAPDERPFPVSVITLAGNVAREIKRFREDYQYLVIDCPPTVAGDASQLAMSAADCVLIPVLPSPVDLWASIKLANAVEQAKMLNPALKAHLVINQLEVRNALSRAMKDALAEFDIPTLESCICRRAIYRTSAIEGNSVFGMGKRGAAAAEEIESIINEVI